MTLSKAKTSFASSHELTLAFKPRPASFPESIFLCRIKSPCSNLLDRMVASVLCLNSELMQAERRKAKLLIYRLKRS